MKGELETASAQNANSSEALLSEDELAELLAEMQPDAEMLPPAAGRFAEDLRPSDAAPRRAARCARIGAFVIIVALGWTMVCSFRYDAPRLAFGALVAANAVGCCVMLSRRGAR